MHSSSCTLSTSCLFMCVYAWSQKGISHLGDSFRVGMWQARWKTLGHLSQQSSSPPFWQTAHQSSLGSSSGSALFSDSGCDWGWGRLSLESDPGGGAGGETFCSCRGLDCAPVLLSGRLEPTLDCTCRWERVKKEQWFWGWTNVK